MPKHGPLGNAKSREVPPGNDGPPNCPGRSTSVHHPTRSYRHKLQSHRRVEDSRDRSGGRYRQRATESGTLIAVAPTHEDGTSGGSRRQGHGLLIVVGGGAGASAVDRAVGTGHGALPSAWLRNSNPELRVAGNREVGTHGVADVAGNVHAIHIQFVASGHDLVEGLR